MFLYLRKNSQPIDASYLSMEDNSRKRRKINKLSVGGRWSDYLLPSHPYGDNHHKKREFGGNIVAFMPHAFTSLSLVENECLRNLTQDINARLCPVGCKKMSRSRTTTENKSVERSMIECLDKVKAKVIRYNLWMSCKTEGSFLVTSH